MVLNLQEFAAPGSFDAALLKRAVADWSDPDVFDDDDVKAVKDLFCRVFGIELELRGSPVEDALLLFPTEDKEADTTRMYAVQVKASGEFRWVHWVMSNGWSFNMAMPLDEILMVLAMSELMHRERYDSDEESGSSDGECDA